MQQRWERTEGKGRGGTIHQDVRNEEESPVTNPRKGFPQADGEIDIQTSPLTVTPSGQGKSVTVSVVSLYPTLLV